MKQILLSSIIIISTLSWWMCLSIIEGKWERKWEIFQPGVSVIKQLYGNRPSIAERYGHHYEVNPEYVRQLQEAGMMFVVQDKSGQRMQILELKNHEYFVATQFRPEYLSRLLHASLPFLGLILTAVGKLTSYLNRDCRLSSPPLSDEKELDENEDLE